MTFISYYVFENINEVTVKEIKFNYKYLFLSILLITLSLILQHSIWFLITYMNSANISYIDSMKIRIYSELGKYIPGRLVLYGILLYLYKQRNISQKKVAFCSIFESVSSIISALFVFLISIQLVEVPIGKYLKVVAFISLIFFLFLIHPRILQALMNTILKIIKKETIIIEMDYKRILIIAILSSIIWLLFGVSFYFLINSFYSLSISYYWFLIGAFAFSAFFGFIAFFVPAGMGIREGSLIIILGKILIAPIAGIVAITSRLLIIAGDIIVTLIIFIIDFFSVKPIYKEYFK